MKTAKLIGMSPCKSIAEMAKRWYNKTTFTYHGGAIAHPIQCIYNAFIRKHQSQNTTKTNQINGFAKKYVYFTEQVGAISTESLKTLLDCIIIIICNLSTKQVYLYK